MHLQSGKWASSQAYVAWLGALALACALVSPMAWGGMIGNEQTTAPLIRLRTTTFAPPAGVWSTSSSPGAPYHLVQFDGPITEAQRSALIQLGAIPLAYIPDYAFVVRIGPGLISKVGALPHVRYVGPYRPDYKIAPYLAGRTGDGRVLMRLFAGEDAADVASRARQLGLQILYARGQLLEVQGSLERARSLATLPAVEWMEPSTRRKLMNDRSRALVGAPQVWERYGLYGKGQVVAITDTGLSTGDPTTLHPDFQGRVRATFGLAATGDWSDEHGHGTHVAGTIAGSGAASGANPAARDYGGSFAGVAPEAQLVIQAVGIDPVSNDQVGLPQDLNDLFQQAYDQGARIHNDSWGDSDAPFGEYNLHAQQVDEYVWRHPDLAVFFASGNEARDGTNDDPWNVWESPDGVPSTAVGVVRLGSLCAPGTAKDSFSIGATEGFRPPSENWSGYSQLTWRIFGFNAEPMASDYISDNPSGMAAFSGRGPTHDGRVKPDLVAPGTDIISTASYLAPPSSYWAMHDSNYAYSGGTSMSCAVASGCAALVRQLLSQRYGIENPSAALVKATMIASADDITPGQYTNAGIVEVPPRPNPVEGWGRINLAPLVRQQANGRGLSVVQEAPGLTTGQSRQYRFRVAGAPAKLVAALAWSDPPGAPEADRSLVNDLDMSVFGPRGDRLTPVGKPDRLNNVELAEIAQPRAGIYTVEVTGANVPDGPQPFALAVLRVDRGNVPGDLNGDGKVTAADALIALRIAVGALAPSPQQLDSGDVAPDDGDDGIITLSDVQRILRRSVGSESDD